MFRGHRSIFITALFSLSCQIYGPLGGAYFNIAPVNISQNASVVVSDPVGLSWLFNIVDLGLDPFGVCHAHLIQMFGRDADIDYSSIWNFQVRFHISHALDY